MATYVPDPTKPTRVTLAIARLPETFTQGDVMREGGLAQMSVSVYTKEMLRIGMIVVSRIGQHGVKIYRKTDQYHPPADDTGEKRLRSASHTASVIERESTVPDCLARLGAAMRCWRVTESRL